VGRGDEIERTEQLLDLARHQPPHALRLHVVGAGEVRGQADRAAGGREEVVPTGREIVAVIGQRLAERGDDRG